MSMPLVMLGPGGDYTTRYHVQGQRLHKQAAAPERQHADTDSGGSLASWGRLPRRGRGSDHDGGGGQPSGQAPRPADRFEVVEHGLLDEPVISDHRPVVTEVVLRD